MAAIGAKYPEGGGGAPGCFVKNNVQIFYFCFFDVDFFFWSLDFSIICLM